jgi:hypothetical protein
MTNKVKTKFVVPEWMTGGKELFRFKKKDAKTLGVFLAGQIRHRIQKRHLSMDNTGFAAYSKNKGFHGHFQSYSEYRAEHGRGQGVDLTFTGSMLGSVNVLKVKEYRNNLDFTVGPNAARIIGEDGKTRPPNNSIGYWLHYGTSKGVPPRPWLGVKKDGQIQKDLGRMFNDLLVLRLKNTKTVTIKN